MTATPTTRQHEDAPVPDLLHAVLAAIAAGVEGVRTTFPCVVVRYTAAPVPVADIRPVVRAGRAAVTLSAVPILFPGGGGCAASWPLRPGDDVIVSVAERSLDEWRSGARGDVTAADPRRFDVTDAVAVPVATRAAGQTDCYAVGYPTGASLKLDERGKLSLGSPAVELVAVLVDLLTTLQGMIIDVAGPTAGKVNVVTAAQLKSIELQLRTLKR